MAWVYQLTEHRSDPVTTKMIELKGLERAKSTMVVSVDVNVAKLETDVAHRAMKDQKAARSLVCPLLPSELAGKVIDVWNVKESCRNWYSASMRVPEKDLCTFLKHSGMDEVWVNTPMSMSRQ
eukprot:2944003-Amphidinium_carterae.1